MVTGCLVWVPLPQNVWESWLGSVLTFSETDCTKLLPTPAKQGERPKKGVKEGKSKPSLTEMCGPG